MRRFLGEHDNVAGKTHVLTLIIIQELFSSHANRERLGDGGKLLLLLLGLEMELVQFAEEALSTAKHLVHLHLHSLDPVASRTGQQVRGTAVAQANSAQSVTRAVPSHNSHDTTVLRVSLSL